MRFRSLRVLSRSPGFVAACVLILGLGIGTATAVFSVFKTALLRALPIRDQDRVVALWPLGQGGTESPLDAALAARLRTTSRTMVDIAGFAHWGAFDAAISVEGEPRPLRQARVSTNFFSVLGASAVAGRLFQSSDRAESDRVAVLSYGAWQRIYGGDPTVVGKQLDWLSGDELYTIVGVAPAGLDYPIGTDVWMPLWPGMPVDMVGRLRPGSTVAAARAELAAVVTDKRNQTGGPELMGAYAATLPEVIFGNVRPVVVIVTAAAGLLLLIACINVGNLLLLRASSRSREIAICRALGASRGEIVRQLLGESAILAVAGGLVGLAAAAILLRLFVAVAPADLPRVDMIRLEGMPIVVAIAVTALTVVLTGVAPFVGAGRSTGDGLLLRSDGRGGTETRTDRRVRAVLVAGEVALALVVLSGASLLARSLIRLETLPLGYGTDRLAIIELVPPPAAFDTTYASWLRSLDRALPAIAAVPGVVAATPLLAPPFTGSNTFTTTLEAEGSSGGPTPIVSFEAVGRDFFEAFDLPLQQGSGWAEADRTGQPPVAVVTESIARWLWPGADPVGRRVRFAGNTGEQSWFTVVGVTDDIHFRELRAATPTIFLEYHQLKFWQGTVAIRARGDATAILGQVRGAVKTAAPELGFWRARPMNVLLRQPLARPRMDAAVLAGFGVSALALAAMGLYAVIAATVRQRRRELGIRIALGADAARIRRLVLREILLLIGIGGSIGLIGSLVSSRLLTGVLFEISPTDPVSVLGAAVLLLATGMVAGLFPARQATRVNPIETLRDD